MYDYSCKSCEKKWEAMNKIAEREKPANEPCPHCGAENSVSVLIGAPLPCNPYYLSNTSCNKLDGGMKDVFRKIHDQNPGSTLSSKF